LRVYVERLPGGDATATPARRTVKIEVSIPEFVDTIEGGSEGPGIL